MFAVEIFARVHSLNRKMGTPFICIVSLTPCFSWVLRLQLLQQFLESVMQKTAEAVRCFLHTTHSLERAVNEIARPVPAEEIRRVRQPPQRLAKLRCPRLSQTAALRSQTPWSFLRRDNIETIRGIVGAMPIVVQAFV